MYEFIRLQYLMGRITREQVLAIDPKYLSDDEKKEIVNPG